LQDGSNKKKRTPTADDSNQRDRSLSVSLPSSRESEGSLEAELPSHAFSSDSENGDDNTNPTDNDEMINEPAPPIQPTSDTAAHNTSSITQAASSTVPEPSAQAADISINTQAVSGIDTISTLQDNDKVKIERLVRNFINVFIQNPELWKEFNEVVNSSPTNITKKTQSHSNPAIKLEPSNVIIIVINI
jgi:hypothetical protein